MSLKINKLRNLYLIIILVLAITIFPEKTGAQNPLGSLGGLASELNIVFTPNYPKPSERVVMSLEMYSENLDTADISFYFDGKLTARGKGLRSVSFNAPEAGKEVEITVSISFENGNSFSKTIKLNPAGLTILYEADSYVPPLYKGKALFAPQGTARLLAIPRFGSSLSSVNNASNLVYKWSINEEAKLGLSGFGKNTAIISGSILGKVSSIEVTATDPETGRTAVGQIDLIPTDPEIIFYENNPLFGFVYEKAVTGLFNINGEEVNIVVAPYNTSRGDLASVKYIWRINGNQASDIFGPSVIFRKPGSSSGTSFISLEVENPLHLLQLGQNSFSLKFEKNEQIGF